MQQAKSLGIVFLGASEDKPEYKLTSNIATVHLKRVAGGMLRLVMLGRIGVCYALYSAGKLKGHGLQPQVKLLVSHK